MKKICFVICMLCLLIIVSNGTKVNASENDMDSKIDYLVDFMEENILEFRRRYNEKVDDENSRLSINYIEGYSLILNKDYDEYCLYFDFDGDNGYMLAGFDFNIYLIENCGDLDYLKDVILAYYSAIDGFLYFDNGEYKKYESNLDLNVDYGAAGQTGSGGDGHIYDIDAYMADRYPSYTFVHEEIESYTPDYIPYSQIFLSYYVKEISDDGGSSYSRYASEGNCAVVAAYGMMEANRINYVLPEIPTDTDVVDVYSTIKSDPLYQAYGTGVGGVGIDSYWTINSQVCLENIPIIYKQLRDYVVANCGYTPVSGLTIEETEAAIEYVATSYGYKSFDLYYSDAFTSTLTALNNQVPALVGVSNSIDYGNHMMVLFGYRQYTYETGWWIWKETKTAYFFLVDDGRNSEAIFFDPNKASSLKTEFLYY